MDFKVHLVWMAYLNILNQIRLEYYQRITGKVKNCVIPKTNGNMDFFLSFVCVQFCIPNRSLFLNGL